MIKISIRNIIVTSLIISSLSFSIVYNYRKHLLEQQEIEVLKQESIDKKIEIEKYITIRDSIAESIDSLSGYIATVQYSREGDYLYDYESIRIEVLNYEKDENLFSLKDNRIFDRSNKSIFYADIILSEDIPFVRLFAEYRNKNISYSSAKPWESKKALDRFTKEIDILAEDFKLTVVIKKLDPAKGVHDIYSLKSSGEKLFKSLDDWFVLSDL